MWITGLVDVPETVLLAQQQRRLVVFAGAGVSAAEPSSLPLFVRLAERIAAGACVPVTDDVKTNPDVFLGRLEGNGVPVHGRVKALVAESARPNRVHDVRHTAATALKDLCVPARDAQLILGHPRLYHPADLSVPQHGL